mgnify:CR=1 FL=1
MERALPIRSRCFDCSLALLQHSFKALDIPVPRLQETFGYHAVTQSLGQREKSATGGVFQVDELQKRRWNLTTHRQHAQAIAVRELQRWVTALQFSPEFPYSEISLVHGGVVEQHHSPVAELGSPGFKIVADRLVGMQAIDVEQVDRVRLKA